MCARNLFASYSHASFEWAFNEPFFQIPGTKIAMSIGRYVTLFLGGIVVALLLGGNIPSWVLPAHIVLCNTFAIAFARIMKRPKALVEEDAVEATGVSVVPPAVEEQPEVQPSAAA